MAEFIYFFLRKIGKCVAFTASNLGFHQFISDLFQRIAISQALFVEERHPFLPESHMGAFKGHLGIITSCQEALWWLGCVPAMLVLSRQKDGRLVHSSCLCHMAKRMRTQTWARERTWDTYLDVLLPWTAFQRLHHYEWNAPQSRPESTWLSSFVLMQPVWCVQITNMTAI